MKKHSNIPKGSYHAFCREYYHIQYQQPIKSETYYKNSRKGYPKTVQTQRTYKVDQFNTFQDYLTNLNNSTQQLTKHVSKSVAVQPKNIQTQRKSTHNKYSLQRQQQQTNRKLQQFNRKPYTQQNRQKRIKSQKNSINRFSNKVNNNNELVGAFLPYFKVKIDRQQKQQAKGIRIKLDEKKFRLKQLLVQQNKVVDRWFAVM